MTLYLYMYVYNNDVCMIWYRSTHTQYGKGWPILKVSMYHTMCTILPMVPVCRILTVCVHCIHTLKRLYCQLVEYESVEFVNGC